MTGLWQDVRHGAYLLRKHLALTAGAALTLAVAIGATATIFGVVDAVILRPLPFTDASRLVQIWETTPNGDDFSASEPDFIDFAARNRSLIGLGAYRPATLALTGAGEAIDLRAAAVSHTLFPLLGVRVAMGRTFQPEEDVAGDSSHVVVLSHAAWRGRFGADSSILGRPIALDGTPRVVIGVLSPEPRFPAGEVFVPLHASPNTRRSDHWLGLVGRLRPGVELAAAQSDFANITRALGTLYPTSRGWGARLEPLSLALVDAKLRRGGWVLLAATGLLLLLACANVANLLLVRATARQTEMGVRAAIGAGRGRLVRQLVVESGLLVFIAAGLGVLASFWGIEAVRTLGADRIPRIDTVAVDARVVAAALALTVITGLLCGLPPALRAGRVDPASVLGDARGMVSPRHRRLRDALVVFQVALSIVLLAGAGLLLRSFSRLGAVNVGYDLEHVLAANINLPTNRYDEEGRAVFFARLTRSLRGMPDVRAVGATAVDPLTEWNFMNDVTPEDRAAVTPGSGFMQASWRSVTPEFFAALGLSLVRGRLFDASDPWNGPSIAVVSQRFAARMWPDQDPIGKRFYWGGTSGRLRTVIGVVGDIRDVSPQSEPFPTLFLPYNQVPMPGMTLVVRSGGDPMALAGAVRAAIQALDPTLPVGDLRPLTRNRANAMATPRFNLLLISGFAALALALASSGLYSVVAYNVAYRRREVGVRLAIGAMPAQVVRDFARHGLGLTLLGTVFGLGVALLLTQTLRGLLFDISPADPLTFVVIVGTVAFVALLASYVPARRAAGIAPVDALRAD